jgi:hypothetical protein
MITFTVKYNLKNITYCLLNLGPLKNMGKKNRGTWGNGDSAPTERAFKLILKENFQIYVVKYCGIRRRTPRNLLKSGCSEREFERKAFTLMSRNTA